MSTARLAEEVAEAAAPEGEAAVPAAAAEAAPENQEADSGASADSDAVEGAVEGAALEGFVSARKETLTTSDAIQNIIIATAAAGVFSGLGGALGRKLSDVENTQLQRQLDEAGVDVPPQQREKLKPAKAKVVDT